MRQNINDLKSSSLNVSLLNGEEEGNKGSVLKEKSIDLIEEVNLKSIPREKYTKLIRLDQRIDFLKFKIFNLSSGFKQKKDIVYEMLGENGGEERTLNLACDVVNEDDDKKKQLKNLNYFSKQGLKNFLLDSWEDSTNQSINKKKRNLERKENDNGYGKMKYKFGTLLEIITRKKGELKNVHKNEVTKISSNGSFSDLNQDRIYLTNPNGEKKKNFPSGRLYFFTWEEWKARQRSYKNLGDHLREILLDESQNMGNENYLNDTKKGTNVRTNQYAANCVKFPRGVEKFRNRHRDKGCRAYLKNIKQLLNLCDEELKDLVQICNFEIDLDINSFYLNFIKENSDNSISTYNIGHNKNIYDVKQFRGHTNEKVTTYKQSSSFNFGTYLCNICVHEYCYFCYDLLDESLLRAEPSKCIPSHICDGEENKIKCSFHSNGDVRNNHNENHRLLVDHASFDLTYHGKVFNENGNVSGQVQWKNKMNEKKCVEKDAYSLCTNEGEKMDDSNKLRKKTILHKNSDIVEKEEDTKKLATMHSFNKKQNYSNDENYLDIKDIISNNPDEKKKNVVIKKEKTTNGCSCQRMLPTNQNDMECNMININNPIREKINHMCGDKVVGKRSLSQDRIFFSEQADCFHKNYKLKDINMVKGSSLYGEKVLCDMRGQSIISEENKKLENSGTGKNVQEKILTNIYTRSSIDTCNSTNIKSVGNQPLGNSFEKKEGENEKVKTDRENLDIMQRKRNGRKFFEKLKKMFVIKRTTKVISRKIRNDRRTANCSKGGRFGIGDMWKNMTKRNVLIGGHNKREDQNMKLKNVNLWKEHRKGSAKEGFNDHCQDETRNEGELLTNEYIDNNFNEIYYIQRINVNNDSLFVFVRIYQIYIFSKKCTNSRSSEISNNDESLFDKSAAYRTNVSVYVLVVLRNNLLKCVIKKKVLNEIRNCVDKWKKHIITKAELIKEGSVPVCIKMIQKNENVVHYIIKNVEYFIDNYLSVFFHIIVTNINNFFGINESKTLENYFQRTNKKFYHFIHKKKVQLTNIYYDIFRKNKEKKKKKKKNSLLKQKKEHKRYSFYTCLFKKKIEHKNYDSSCADKYSLHNPIFEPTFYYITSHQVAYNYITHMNNIYLRRLVLLYFFVFIFYLIVTICPIFSI
ncbi:hypothetical protein, conserved [Plasmodium gonderi]|uniref:Uncharacterized protein n=1 Tax=Plasmodium gonderi TaxID=77519 RepID=A0A1Y1JDK3_PLAGO|nr:hypothetical protein, conserved [Plasmodium gonderi]GAW80611.1 hypothetical protein, conserved [Plasmodium gonderi]